MIALSGRWDARSADLADRLPYLGRVVNRARLADVAIVRRYGSWSSPISAASLATSGVRLAEASVDGDDVYWLEGRPAEAGRQAVVRLQPDGTIGDATGRDFNVRTLVHEYGGGSYVVSDGVVWFSNFGDQRVWRSDAEAITADPPIERGARYADYRLSPDSKTLYAVRETHSGGEASNDIVAISADGSGETDVVADGHDFYSAPTPHPDGRTLGYVRWDHPHMPWQSSELVVVDLATGAEEVIAGGPAESVQQPAVSPAGDWWFVTDRSGWWNLSTDRGGVLAEEAEYGLPHWVFGRQIYGFVSDGRAVAVRQQNGVDQLVLVDGGGAEVVTDRFCLYGRVVVDDKDRVVTTAAAVDEAPAIVRISLDGTVEVLHSSTSDAIAPELIARPEPVEFPTTNGQTAFALFYAPHNPEFVGPPNERPPVLVESHGGPTAAASPALDRSYQYWTSRGFAVLDVNYGGSTGYGREYRGRLFGEWGIVDVDDCINAARHVAAEGRIDGDRMAIRGGSAGGYTTLCALTFHDVFAAGASHFGVADAETLAADTHKFEARYLDSLIGPYPDAIDTYRQRSPIHFTDRLSAPMILLQGSRGRDRPARASRDHGCRPRQDGHDLRLRSVRR